MPVHFASFNSLSNKKSGAVVGAAFYCVLRGEIYAPAAISIFTPGPIVEETAIFWM
jgi:hypothetical protein